MYKKVVKTYKVNINGKTKFITVITTVLIYLQGYLNEFLSIYSLWIKITKQTPRFSKNKPKKKFQNFIFKSKI